MFFATEKKSSVVVAPQSQISQAVEIRSMPENRPEFNRKFWTLFQRITQMSGGNVHFGEHDSYFVSLPGGNNPYAYLYDDDTAFAEIWQNVILAEHGWAPVQILERMLIEDAKYDEKENQVTYDRKSLSDHNLSTLNRSCRVIDCQLKGRIIDKENPQVLFFVIADKYDVQPLDRAGGRHMIPYTEDGTIWLWSLARLGLRLRANSEKTTNSGPDEQKRQKFAKDFTKQLTDLQKVAIVKDYIGVNNGVDVLFSCCSERLFFGYNKGGMGEFNHLVSKIQEFMYGDAAYGSVVGQINRDTIRDWFIYELRPLAEQVSLPLFVESDRKYRFPVNGSSRRESFTLTNYRKVWRILTDADCKR